MNARACTDCLVVKKLSEFRAARGYADGHQRICAACYGVRRNQWRAKGGTVKENATAAAKVRKAAWNKSAKAAAGRAKPENRKAAVVRTVAWYRANPIKRAANVSKRRAREVAAGGSHTSAEALALLEGNDGKCAYCPNPATQFDHVVPLARGGTNDIDNLLPACRPCNSSKRHQPLFKWLEKKYAA